MVLASLALAGCGGSARQSLGELPAYAELATVVSVDKALALPAPGGPAVLNIVQKTTSNSITQTIFLANDSRSRGENQLTVTYWGPVGRDGWHVEFNPQRPTKASIYKEMQAALPGVGMHFSDYYVQNKYGPFGYAIGVPSSGGLCLYGWQLIKAKPRDFFAPNLKRGAIGVRLRMCQANVTEAQLLQIMYDYTITGYFEPGQWDPFGDLPPVNPALGTISSPIVPVGREGLSSPIVGDVPMNGEVQGAVGRTRTTTPRRVRRAQPVQTAPIYVQPLPTATRPEVGYPVVPPPPGSTGKTVPTATAAEAFESAFPTAPQRVTAPQPVMVRPTVPAAAAPLTTVPAAPRVVAPQVTPGYSTLPTRVPAYPSAYPAAQGQMPAYPTTTPSIPSHATVPAPPAAVPAPGLTNPYNQ
ncbi:cellulose biosynthesis protein BcsN [Segnochrobactraceae bacterium EtOH-i3]